MSVHRLGQHLGGLDDLIRRDTRYLGGPVKLCVGLLEQPLFVFLEVRAQLPPSGTPLPGGVPGTAPHAGVDLPRVGHPALDEFAVFPTGFQYHPGYRKLENGVAARYELQQQTAVFFGPSNPRGLAREHEDKLLVSRHHPLSEDDCLAFERVGAGEEDDVGCRPVLVGGAERVDARVVQTGSVGARSGLVVGRVGGGDDGAEGQLGNGVGVLEILVGVGLHRPRRFTVGVQDMARDPRHDFKGRVPRYGSQLPVHPEKRGFEPVGGGAVGVVDLEGQGTSPDAVIAKPVDHPGVGVRLHDHMVRLPVNQGHVVLIRTDPALERPRGHVDTKGVLVRAGAALLSDRPSKHPVAAADYAVVAGGGVHLGVRRREGDSILGHVLFRHLFCPFVLT